ncbi:MAG: hypothetical protein JWN70_6471 [Planctomycetaceae bacterium]|nr:hypothetical protein [Planctomycetaceae bacterium]
MWDDDARIPDHATVRATELTQVAWDGSRANLNPRSISCINYFAAILIDLDGFSSDN